MSHPADQRVLDLQRELGAIRAKQGLSARSVAEAAEIDAEWLEQFEEGYESGRSPTVRVTERVANALGMTLTLTDL